MIGPMHRNLGLSYEKGELSKLLVEGVVNPHDTYFAYKKNMFEKIYDCNLVCGLELLIQWKLNAKVDYCLIVCVYIPKW